MSKQRSMTWGTTFLLVFGLLVFLTGIIISIISISIPTSIDFPDIDIESDIPSEYGDVDLNAPDSIDLGISQLIKMVYNIGIITTFIGFFLTIISFLLYYTSNKRKRIF